MSTWPNTLFHVKNVGSSAQMMDQYFASCSVVYPHCTQPHRVWQAEEIVSEILLFLRDDFDFRNKYVLRMALVNRRLFSTAMDILWGKQPVDPGAFLQVLVASGAICELGRESRFGIPHLEAQRELGVLDWERLKVYAHRVRSIRWPHDHIQNKPNIKIFHDLIQASPEEYPLPQLQRLSITSSWTPDPGLTWSRLCTPGLSMFKLTIKDTSGHRLHTITAMDAWLGEIARRCPSLEELCITSGPPMGRGDLIWPGQPLWVSRTAKNSLMQHLPQLKKLRKIRIKNVMLHLDLLGYLAGIPQLEDLTLGLVEDHELSRPTSSRHLMPSFPFSNLYSIRLIAVDQKPEDIWQAIHMSATPHIAHITLECDFSAPDSIQYALSAYIACPEGFYNGLQSIHLYHSRRPGTPHSRQLDTSLTIETLSSLLTPQCKTLTHLSITTLALFHLGDDDVNAIAEALPNIEQLVLGRHMEVDGNWPVPRITFRGLLSLRKACPKLEHLGLSVDLSELSDHHLYLERDVVSQRSQLHTWNMMQSKIGNIETTRVILASWFPDLACLCTDSCTPANARDFSYLFPKRLNSAEYTALDCFVDLGAVLVSSTVDMLSGVVL